MGPRYHWESCLAVLVVILASCVALLLSGCGGSRFFDAPEGEPPDTSNCTEVHREFGSRMPYTPVPFPFEGTRKVKMWTAKPQHWQRFEGSLHLMEASWDVQWIDVLRMSLEPYPVVAYWDGHRWDVEPRIDLAPYLEVDGEHLTFEPKFYAKGMKPAGKPVVRVRVTVAACGPGREWAK